MLDATPSIELKKRIGARKKIQKSKKKIKKKQTKTDTFQKPLESLSGNNKKKQNKTKTTKKQTHFKNR